ncbi:hypothetical protein EI693_09145 [Pseudomonas oryziphila]|uniref:Uncharacterized protein n=1 Tax=Pseudomonas oryziphila TaxID=2894079 RepID=A0ABM7CP56_9PSED|nr:hypothetical protein EI693_09145 [Pseudomonas oryziphila]
MRISLKPWSTVARGFRGGWTGRFDRLAPVNQPAAARTVQQLTVTPPSTTARSAWYRTGSSSPGASPTRALRARCRP